jgi:hypothetical protein
MDDELLRQAGRLIQFGLQPRLYPGQDREYKELLARLRLDLEFDETVRAIADGLGLEVAATSDLGFFLAAQSGSVFAYTLGTFRRERGTAASVDDRLLHGLAMVAIVAYFYPNARDIEHAEIHSATARDVDRFLRGVCEDLKRKTKDSDVLIDQPEFEQAWHLYLRHPEAVGTSDRRRAQRGALAIFDRCLTLLDERGLVRAQKDGQDAAYVPMERMRVMAGSVAGHYAYETLARYRRDQQEVESK